MATREQGDEQRFDHAILADDGLSHLRLQLTEAAFAALEELGVSCRGA